MNQALVIRAMIMAINLRQPNNGLIFHSDRGSQYACKAYQKLLKNHSIIPSMSGKGNCYDNAVVERFFGSLKSEWLYGNQYATRLIMANDINLYIRYYNHKRLHPTLYYNCPVAFENSFIKVSN